MVGVVASLALIEPSPTAAQGSTPVGTHLGEGDPQAQAAILDMIATKGAGAGYPVTVIIQTTFSDSDVQTIAEAVQRHSFSPIVRIGTGRDDTCRTMDSNQIVSSVRTHFGSNTPIVFGNEVNKKEVECGDYGLWLSNYDSITNRSNLGPSTLDYYDTIYPAQEFLDTVGSNYTGDVYFANAYGCVGVGTKANCDPEATDTQNAGYQPAASRGRFYITEFSLSPEGNSAFAPDTDLNKVLRFISTHAGNTGAEAVTPLIRNVCNGDGEWLLYVNGDVYTRSGTKINPDSCSGVKTAPYYLYPIESLQENIADPKEHARVIGQELVSQGYEVNCTAPQILFEGQVNNWEAWDAAFPNAAPPTQFIQSSQFIDYSSANYPLFRYTQEANTVNDSIEAHFGYRELSISPDDLTADLKSAPLYRLTSPEQQCQMQKSIIETIYTMCQKLENPDECALYQPIRGSDYTTETIRIPAQNFSCQDDLTNPDKTEVATALRNTPLYLDKAYRLGFIVFSARQRISIDEPDTNLGWDFLVDRDNNPRSEPKDEVRVIAFKLPDIGTNKDPNSDIYYSDPLMITRDLITTPEEQQQFLEDIRQEREEFAENVNIAANFSFPSNEVLIDCSGEYCQDPLSRALVNLLNSGSFGDSCSEELQNLTRFETAEEIKTPVTLKVESAGESETAPEQTESESEGGFMGTFFKDSFQLLSNIFQRPESAQADPQSAEYSFDSKLDAKKLMDTPGAGQFPGELNTYLIYPVGYELEDVEQALAGLFKTPEQLANLTDPDEVEPFFILSEAKQSFETDKPFFDFLLPGGLESCPPTITDEFGNIVPNPGCDRQMNFETNDTIVYRNDTQDLGGEGQNESRFFFPRIHGGILGQTIRDIQQTLRRAGTREWLGVNQCKDLEDFFLGECSGDNADSDFSYDDDTPQQCKALYGRTQMTIYDRERTFREVVDVAGQYVNEADHYRFAQLLWGVLEIEGSPYLRRMRELSPGQTGGMSCSETINSCGAVGPLQIVQGVCVSDACPYSRPDLLRSFERPEDLCDLNTALNWTAANLKAKDDPSLPTIKRFQTMAGAHGGFGDCTSGVGTMAIQGCNGLNYCECASEGFSDRFDAMAAEYGF